MGRSGRDPYAGSGVIGRRGRRAGTVPARRFVGRRATAAAVGPAMIAVAVRPGACMIALVVQTGGMIRVGARTGGMIRVGAWTSGLIRVGAWTGGMIRVGARTGGRVPATVRAHRTRIGRSGRDRLDLTAPRTANRPSPRTSRPEIWTLRCARS